MARRVNLIPMAGAGQRFLDAGYTTCKPLIHVGNVPMIVKAAHSLPSPDEWIFICRDHHIKEAGIDAVLQEHFHNAKVISIKKLTEGQACTCLLAKSLLRPDDILTIGACDNAMTYDDQLLKTMMESNSVDALIWTFRKNPVVLQNPQMYGWVVVDSDNYVEKVRCKIPVSNSPMNDHTVIGTFTFKRAEDFIDCTNTMIAADRRINNEFYIDEAMNVLVEKGLRVKVFEVDRYICWGTPRDVETYHYWQSYFQQVGL